MPLRHCILASTLALSLPVAAHEPNFCDRPRPHPIDQRMDAAIARSGGVTADMRDAQGAAYAAWDRELNRIYARLMKALPKDAASALRASQRAWLAWDRAQAAADQALQADAGSAAALQVAASGLSRLRARVCELGDWEEMVAER